MLLLLGGVFSLVYAAMEIIRAVVSGEVQTALGRKYMIIVAIKKAAGPMVFNPPAEAIMEVGDILISLGNREQLDQLDTLASGDSLAS
jgi:uncharacterized protein with PhoU and TrkA domain